MSIIGSLPFTLTNGTTADATQVMSDFNTIVNNVNTNAAVATGPSTWTPVDSSGAGLAFNTIFASWNQVGNMVFASASLIYPANNSNFPALIGGLPVPVPNNLYATPPAPFLNNTIVTAAYIAPIANVTYCEILTPEFGGINNASLTVATCVFQVIYPAS